MRNVYVVSAVRTPVGKRNGYLREWAAPELLGFVLNEVVRRVGVDGSIIEDVISGTVNQVGEQGFCIGRTGVLASNFPETVPGTSVNRQCGSSLTAIHMAYGMIASDTMDVVIASGVETMSKYDISSDVGGVLPNGKPQGIPYGEYYMKRLHGLPLLNMAQAAQEIARRWGITRLQCEEFALSSHQKAHAATVNGYFKREIVPTQGLDKDGRAVLYETDETIRADTSLAKLAALGPVLDTQFITAGTASPVTDGASAVLLMSEESVKKYNLRPLARIVANAVVGSDPGLVLTGPLYATPKVLKKAGLQIADIDIFEVNEAFAPVPIIWGKELDAPMDRLNVNGGALALGHPVGSSGCRLSVTAIYELIRRQARYALVTLCTGGGMAPATIYERV
jgi:acetyl-CoA acyltransferase